MPDEGLSVGLQAVKDLMSEGCGGGHSLGSPSDCQPHRAQGVVWSQQGL